MAFAPTFPYVSHPPVPIVAWWAPMSFHTPASGSLVVLPSLQRWLTRGSVQKICVVWLAGVVHGSEWCGPSLESLAAEYARAHPLKFPPAYPPANGPGTDAAGPWLW